MKTILALAFLTLFSPAGMTSAHADHDHLAAAKVKCDCPPDCYCHKPGGSCPGVTCTEDCDCDKMEMINGKPVFIHPSVREAIAKRELRLTGSEDGSDFVMVEGIKQFTGFKPSWEFYRATEVINVKADPELIAKYIKTGLSHRDFSYSPVHGQIQGSCWAEGAGSAYNLNTNAVNGTKEVCSVQDIIDCSGYGTARSGGSAALPYAIDGLATEAKYPYTGRDGRCRTDVERVTPLKKVGILRGENGNFPTEPELMTAYLLYGAMEVCGSAGALGSGGRQDTPRSGPTNHCYAIGGFKPGALLGWLNKIYWDIINSWGDGIKSIINPGGRLWGDKGWGQYVLAPDGNKIKGSVVTEVFIGYAGEILPKEPVHLHLVSADVTLEVTIPVGVKYTTAVAQEMFQMAID